MKKSSALAALVIVAIAAPAHATHEPIQAPGQGPTSEAMVGIDSQGVATAVWNDVGRIRYATRAPDGFFGVPKTLPGGGVATLWFDESPNGNAAIAWTGTMNQGELLVSIRTGSDGSFGAPQALVADGAAGVFDPRVAVSDAGRAVVVWQESTPTPQIRAALSDYSGVFSDSVMLATGTGTQNPDVEMAISGAAIAVWDDAAAAEIQSSSAPAEGPFGAPQVIETLEQGPGAPDVAVNQDGDAVVVWVDFTTADQCAGLPLCSTFVAEALYGDVFGAFGASTELTDVATPHSVSSCEAEVDATGKAGAICYVETEGVPAIYVALSDDTGVFGPLQGVSVHPHVGGGVATTQMELAAGGGEFTAFWSNDHDEDGAINEAWTSTTTGGAFGEVHQLSPESTDEPITLHGARNDAGATIATWVIIVDGRHVAQMTPVAAGAQPIYGTEGSDSLSGSSGADEMLGLGGNDTLNGRGGNDELDGGKGSDTLKGSGGNDRLDGGPGKDNLVGGKGQDVCVKTRGDTTSSCEKILKG